MLAPLLLLLAQTPSVDAAPGKTTYETRCAPCHGANGAGGDTGPPIASRLSSRDDQGLAAFIRAGVPARGMPPHQISDPDMADLLKYLRVLQRRAADAPQPRHVQLQTIDGRSLEGQVTGEGFDDLQVKTADERIHLLRRSGTRVREVTSDADWPTYNGGPGGNRYTTQTQIDKTTVGRLGVARDRHRPEVAVAPERRLQREPPFGGRAREEPEGEPQATSHGSGRSSPARK